MTIEKDLPIIPFETPEKWRAWLLEHNTEQEGIWLLMFKKDSGVTSITYAEALDEALCFGWIDGQLKKHDEKSWVQRFTTRRAHSKWSVKNTQNIKRLLDLGKMHAAGLTEVTKAKNDGRWDAAYESQKTAQMPDDFFHILNRNVKANNFFKTLNKANKYAIYYRLMTSKNSEMRENRIKMILNMLENGKKFHN